LHAHVPRFDSTRPYLTELEKRWIAFQVLTAMRDARGREVSLTQSITPCGKIADSSNRSHMEILNRKTSSSTPHSTYTSPTLPPHSNRRIYLSTTPQTFPTFTTLLADELVISLLNGFTPTTARLQPRNDISRHRPTRIPILVGCLGPRRGLETEWGRGTER
jgi:hypothetical protein